MTGGVGDDDYGYDDYVKYDRSPSSSTMAVVVPRPRRTTPGVVGPSVVPRSNEEVLRKIDVHAVETTGSYRRWTTLAAGEQFAYNDGTDTTGCEEEHTEEDEVLRKNIRRRMKY